MKTGWERTRSACALLAGVWAISTAQAACELSTYELPVTMEDGAPVATLTLNGEKVRMLVDSGAFYSMLTPSTAEQLKLPKLNLPEGMRLIGYTGRFEAHRTRVDKVGLLGGTLARIDFVVGGNEMGAGIQGLLGRNILAAGDTEYDLANGMVRLMFPKGDCSRVDMAYWAPKEMPVVMVPLESDGHKDNHQVSVRVRINGTSMQALMDSGASRTTLTLDAAKRAGVSQGDLSEAGHVGGMGPVRVKHWRAKFDSFELGGERVGNISFGVADTDAMGDDLLLGLDYFLAHRILVSRTQGKVYLTWNGGPVFAKTVARDVDGDVEHSLKGR
ncbi:retroviral-like aspartic protease family protein [Mitsuaria sp. CC2]|uniref:aspartyl protease family protein n=1 Tax=Mitsuaria sp. CC2 TaxID=3029186 RepID=UPI003B8C9C46